MGNRKISPPACGGALEPYPSKETQNHRQRQPKAQSSCRLLVSGTFPKRTEMCEALVAKLFISYFATDACFCISILQNTSYPTSPTIFYRNTICGPCHSKCCSPSLCPERIPSQFSPTEHHFLGTTETAMPSANLATASLFLLSLAQDIAF